VQKGVKLNGRIAEVLSRPPNHSPSANKNALV
jgi:hypothetical protein